MSNRNILQALQGAAGAAGGAGLDVDEVFSTDLWTGDATNTTTITNGIDLVNEGGLVWFKARSSAENHNLFDTVRGDSKNLISNSNAAEGSLQMDVLNGGGGFTTFKNNGFSVRTANGGINGNGTDLTAWTFRKAPKFFDVVTYTGNGVAGRTVAHNLGAVPGMIILKNLNSSSEGWRVYHRSANGGTNPEQYYAMLQSTNAFAAATTPWNNTAPTSTEFTLGTDTGSNNNGDSFVAYLFAHNNNDGEFGPDSDADVIKCGSFTSNSSGIATVNLGFEPQWVLFKGTHAGSSWFIVDVMRGMVNGSNDAWLAANLTNAEGTSNTVITPTPTGFVTDGTNIIDPSQTFIYMAIRRGPLAVPEDATKVFHVNNYSGNSNSNVHNTGFNVDMNINSKTAGSSSNYLFTRLTNKYLDTNSVATDNTAPSTIFGSKSNVIDLNNGWWGTTNDVIAYNWKRAPGYFDVVCYTGDGSNPRYVNHNLGVQPRMIWLKRRDSQDDWFVWALNNDGTKAYFSQSTSVPFGLNTTNYTNTNTAYSPALNLATSTTFRPRQIPGGSSDMNVSGGLYVAYLFATAPGVSKVGSYTGTNSTLNVDCGFSSGARFVLIKRVDAPDSWILHDSVSGIVAGNDPYLLINTTLAQITGYDPIDPLSSGFTLNGGGFNSWNASGGSYIFYAVA